MASNEAPTEVAAEPVCNHVVPDQEAYVKKHMRYRVHKGKRYGWITCPRCQLMFLSVHRSEATSSAS